MIRGIVGWARIAAVSGLIVVIAAATTAIAALS